MKIHGIQGKPASSVEYDSRQFRAMKALLRWATDQVTGRPRVLADYADEEGLETWTLFRMLRDQEVQKKLLEDPAIMGARVVVLQAIGQFQSAVLDPNVGLGAKVAMMEASAKLAGGKFDAEKDKPTVNIFNQVQVQTSTPADMKAKALENAQKELEGLV